MIGSPNRSLTIWRLQSDTEEQSRLRIANLGPVVAWHVQSGYSCTLLFQLQIVFRERKYKMAARKESKKARKSSPKGPTKKRGVKKTMKKMVTASRKRPAT